MPSPDRIEVKLQATILALGQAIYESDGTCRRISPRRTTQPNPEALEAEILRVLKLVRQSPARRYFGIQQNHEQREDIARLKAFSVISWQMVGDSGISTHVDDVSKLIGDRKGEPCEQLLFARDLLGRMVIKGLFGLDTSRGEPWNGRLCLPAVTFTWLAAGQGHFDPRKFDQARLERLGDQKGNDAATILKRLPTAKELYEKVRQEVVGLDPELKILSSRIALHMARGELLKSGATDNCVGQMVVVLISSSGAGKSYTISRLAAHCGLGFCQYDSTALTCQGYAGADLDEPYRLLVNSVGGDASEASRGIIFFDEADKKSSLYGREVGTLAVQQELLGRLQATSPFVIGGKRSNDGRPFLFDGRPTGYFLAGVFSGLDDVIRKMTGKRNLGFASEVGSRQFVSIQDGLKNLGFLDELVNRVGLVVRLTDPLIESVMRGTETGIIEGFNRVLASKGIVLSLTDKASRSIGDYSMQTKTFYRGAKAVLAAVVEELIFDPKRGAVTIQSADVMRAIDRLSSGLVVPESGVDAQQGGGTELVVPEADLDTMQTSYSG